MLEQGLRDRLAVAPLDAAAQGRVQGVAVSRGRPADLGQDPGSVGLGCRLDQTSGDHLLKSPVTPDRLTQPQTGIGCLDGLDQPGRPARDDLRPSHRTTVTRPLTTHLVSVIVEYRPQVQDLLTSQEPLAPQTHQRSQLGLVMGRPQVLHDPAHTMVLGHDLHGRGPRGCLDLTQVRTHPPDPTAALVPRNDHPTPTIPTKNPTLKHKPPQPVQLRMEASTAHSPLLLLAHLEDRGLPADAADHGHHAVVIRRVRLPSGGAEAAAPS